MNYRWNLCVLMAVEIFCSLSLHAARWKLGPANVIEPKEFGTTERLVIGDGENRTWFWSSGWGISFYPSQDMPDTQDSGELRLGKTAGGRCHWTMTFRFTKPIDKFRFTTPKCSGIEMGGDIFFEYSADGSKAKEIWRYGAKSPGYQKGGEITPQVLPWVTLDKPVENLSLTMVLEGFVGSVPFYAGQDDGGVLEYSVPMLPVEQMVQVKLIPDASRAANIYITGQPLRAFIGVGPKLLAQAPELVAFDAMRKQDTVFKTEPLGTGYLAEMSDLAPGYYELRVRVHDAGKLKLAPAGRLTRVQPPRVLTWAQMNKSAFGIVAIDQTGPLRDGPEIARRIGCHRPRGGSPTWCIANPAKGVYNLDIDARANIQFDMEYGLVHHHSLAFSPGWTVDPKRMQAGGGGWAGHYPPKKEHLADYAEYCRRLAERTKGWYSPEFEIWNEPNNPPFGSFKGTVEEFIDICRTAADAIHAVNPDARMILGTTGGTDLGFIDLLMKAGMDKKYQIIDVHPYRCTDQGPEDGLLVDIRRIKKLISKYGTNQGIIFSEIGWPTDPYYKGGNPCYEPVTYFQQACFFSRTMLISLAMGVERVEFHIIYDWKSDNPKDPEANFGMIDAQGQPKPSLSGYAATARHLDQTKFLGVLKNTPAFHHAWVWDTPWMPDAGLLTVWCDTVMVKGKVQWIDLPGEPVLAEDLWGGPVGKDRLKQTNGRWQVRPGEDPIFIYISKTNIPKDLDPLPQAMRPWHLQRLNAQALKNEKITIDGDLKEWKNLPAEISLDRSIGFGAIGWAGVEKPGATKAKDRTSRFGVAYNDDGLFFGVHVISSRPMKNDQSFWWVWQGDCVRVYMSTVDSRETPYMSKDHFQYIFAPVTNGNGPPQAVSISYATPSGVKSGDLIPGAELKAKNVTDGWTLEAKIPWSYFSRKPKPGETWDFDLEAADRCWNGSESNWHNPLKWGQLQF